MTGKIRTLRVDKGFGFIKDEAGKEYSFTRAPFPGSGSMIFERATVWSSRSARGRRALAPKTCGAHLRKRTESRRRPGVPSSAAAATLLGTATSCPLGRSPRSRSRTICRVKAVRSPSRARCRRESAVDPRGGDTGVMTCYPVGGGHEFLKTASRAIARLRFSSAPPTAPPSLPPPASGLHRRQPHQEPQQNRSAAVDRSPRLQCQG